MADTSLDIDDLFGAAPSVPNLQVKPEPTSPVKPKVEGSEDSKPKIEDDPHFILPKTKAKPKAGRLISNERPLEDYNRLVQGEGDMFKKAVSPSFQTSPAARSHSCAEQPQIQDLSAVVKENVAASFSRSAFPLALECLEAMRGTALTFEEVETYNEYVGGLTGLTAARSTISRRRSRGMDSSIPTSGSVSGTYEEGSQ